MFCVYVQGLITVHFPVKPLRSFRGLQTLMFTTSPAITYTKCCRLVILYYDSNFHLIE